MLKTNLKHLFGNLGSYLNYSPSTKQESRIFLRTGETNIKVLLFLPQTVKDPVLSGSQMSKQVCHFQKN